MERATLESFLAPISAALGHDKVPENITPFNYQADRPARNTDGLAQPALVDMFAEEAAKIRVDVHRVSRDAVAATVSKIVAGADDPGSVVYAADERFDAMGIPEALASGTAVAVTRWDPQAGKDAMVDVCNAARFGITYARGGIAETGTIVQPCSVDCGRAISLLPLAHIAIVDAASIKATLGDWLREIDEKGAAGMPSQVCFISGPSVTSDIELVRVEGVHGPMFVHYIVVDE